MKDPYPRMLKYCLIPAIIIMAAGTLMVVFSKELSFLTLL
jgi:CitMHS family citrate-Mg2+:H+ or citrate-Ca2+:H+ symporter